MQTYRRERPSPWLEEVTSAAWVERHQEEVVAFWQYLRAVNPHSWREEFDRILRDTVETGDERD